MEQLYTSILICTSHYNFILFLTAKQRTICNCLPTLNTETKLPHQYYYTNIVFFFFNYVNTQKTKRLVDSTDKFVKDYVDRDYGNIHYVIDGAEKIYTSRRVCI